MSSSISLFVFRHDFPNGEGKSEVSEKCCDRTWTSVVFRPEADSISGCISYVIPRGNDLKKSKVSVTARFIGQGITKTEKINFRLTEDYQGIIPFFFPGHEYPEFISYPIAFELRVGVKLVPLIKEKTRDFSVAKSRLEDVVLKVEEERFHVSKAVLSSFSPYFEVLFFGLFRESQQSEIELKGIDAETFQDILQIIYHVPDINEDNVQKLLEMARMYDVQPVTDQCLKFVKGRNDLASVEKKWLEMEYGSSN